MAKLCAGDTRRVPLTLIGPHGLCDWTAQTPSGRRLVLTPEDLNCGEEADPLEEAYREGFRDAERALDLQLWAKLRGKLTLAFAEPATVVELLRPFMPLTLYDTAEGAAGGRKATHPDGVALQNMAAAVIGLACAGEIR